MAISKETEVKALVNTLLSVRDLNVAHGALARARLLQPTGKLEGGCGFITDNPRTFYEQRRDMIMDRFRIGARDGNLPRITDLAEEFSCAVSTVHEVKTEWLKEQEAA